LVADGGGPLAYAAFVAREHGLPAVVATVNATKRLRNGQLVTDLDHLR
jgi:pyruvate,water dikinase